MGGEEAMKKFDELLAEHRGFLAQELFSINPKQSYVPDEWIKADPDFWKPKAQRQAASPRRQSRPAAAKKP